MLGRGGFFQCIITLDSERGVRDCFRAPRFGTDHFALPSLLSFFLDFQLI